MKKFQLKRFGLPAAMAVIATTIVTVAFLTDYARKPDDIDLRILWTNDTHGYLTPLFHREEGDDQFLERANQEGRIGGFAYIASIVNRQRHKLSDRTLLLDSGDTWHGTIVPVRMGGSPVVEVMNAMGYDAMTLGNVEMFYGQETLQDLIKAAKFPIVIANLYDAEWGERPALENLEPYIIKQVNGLKVGIIGMTYHWMSKVSDQPQWAFGLRREEIQSDVDKLRNQDKVDVVILLSHMGWKVDTRYAELVSGIDIIVGAHTHNILYRPTLVYNEESQRDVIIVQSGSHGKMLGQLDLTIKKQRVSAFKQTLFPILEKDIEPDPGITELIKKVRAPYKDELERVIGETGTLLYRQGTWQSTADNLVTDALLARSQRDVVVAQPGRYGATVLPGKITVEDVYNMVPTDSTIYQMQFTGKDLREMFEAAVDNIIAGDSDVMGRVAGNMWRYAGIELKVNLELPYPKRIQSIRINNKPVDPEQYYSLAEFNMFFRNSPLAFKVENTNKIGPKEIIAYIEEKGTVAPKLDSRLTDEEGNILGDHTHLEQTWEQSGRNEFDLMNTIIYQYSGRLDAKNRLTMKENQ